MKTRRFSLAILFSVAMLFSCTEDMTDDPSGGYTDDNLIGIDATVDDNFSTTTVTSKGTSITDGYYVETLGIFVNVREGDTYAATGVTAYLDNSEVARNAYHNLEFKTIAYWPALESGQTLGFIAYSPYTDVFDDDAGTTTSSGLSNPTSETMLDLSIDYEVPDEVADQPDLLVSLPVTQSSGAVSLEFSHALATIVFNVVGDGVQPVDNIEVTEIAYKGSLDLEYAYSITGTSGSTTTGYTPTFTWNLETDDDGVSLKKSMFLSIEDGSLDDTYPTETLTEITSATGRLMMIPQTVSAATEIIIEFADGNSRSVRFLDDQIWKAGGLYNYNINITFEGEIVDLTDIETVNTLVGNPYATTLETANCYILNPPLYTKDQELAKLEAAKAAEEDEEEDDTAATAPSYFTRTESTDDSETSETEETYSGALYYIPITSHMEQYYGEGSLAAHNSWAPTIIWYDSPKHPVEECGVIIKRVEERNGESCFSVYIPYDYDNYGNMVVAVMNDNGYIMWSWHLWLTDYNPYYDKALGYDAKANPDYTTGYAVPVEGGELHHYADDTGKSYWANVDFYRNRLIMDRNLGAQHNNLSAYELTDATCGLYYQFGRKDPFPRSMENTTILYDDFVKTASQSTILNSILYPYKYYYNSGAGVMYYHTSTNSGNYSTSGTYAYLYNWCSDLNSDGKYVWGDSQCVNTLMQSNSTAVDTGERSKSRYDPSPIGFMLPTIYVWNDFNTTAGTTSTAACTFSTEGMVYTPSSQDDSSNPLNANYPTTGYRNAASAGVTSTDCCGSWASTSFTLTVTYANYSWSRLMYFTPTATSPGVAQNYTSRLAVASRTNGYPVRPIQRWYEGVHNDNVPSDE